jgi:hypothetical protein
MDVLVRVTGDTLVGRIPRPILIRALRINPAAFWRDAGWPEPAVFAPETPKKSLAIVGSVFYLAVQTTVHRFCTFNGSVGSEGLLWNGQQALVTAVIVEGQHPLPDLLAIKRQ